MRRRSVWILALTLGVGGADALAVGPARATAPPVVAPSTKASSPFNDPAGGGADGKVAGAALTNIEPDSLAEVAGAIQRLKLDGFNTVSLYVWWYTATADADSLETYWGTVSDQELGREISLARSAGLSVTLTLVFYCNGCEGGSRAVLHPLHPNAFFSSYSSFVDHYADLAQADGVSTLFVGSEMSSLEGETNQWEALIAGARRRFHGRIGYEENWDVLGNAKFLGSVDVIGVSAYFPLDAGASPSLAQLLADWHSSSMTGWKKRDWVSEVAGLAARFHKPVLFGEVGYMSSRYAAAHPYLNYYSDPDESLQADLYQALLETFQPYSWWDGVNWFDWEVLPDGPAENGRTFQAKTAEVLLEDWYAQDRRPTSRTTPMS